MKLIRTWRFWHVVFLSLLLAACASREAREEKRAAKEERAEAKRQAREERVARRSGQTEAAPAARPAAAAAPAARPAAADAEADSKLVFMRRSSASGGLINNAYAARIIDITDSDRPIFVGAVKGNRRVEYSLKPGEYTFMVISPEAADFMAATIESGKTYYALVVQRTGFATARYSFQPVRGADKRVATIEKSTQLIDEAPDANWTKDHAAEIADKRARYWPEWSSKPESQRASQTLNAEDGR